MGRRGDEAQPRVAAVVATKQEIELLRVEMKHEFGLVRAEMAGIRTELGGEITGVRAELAGMRNEFGGEITGVRAELAGMRNEFDGEITGVRAELAGMRNEFVTQAMLHAEINRLLLWLFPTLLTALCARLRGGEPLVGRILRPQLDRDDPAPEPARR